jgi:hypothetical protein
VNGILRKIELATLPQNQPNTAFLAAFRPKEGSPVHRGFRQGTRDTQHLEIFIGTNANGGKDGNIPNYNIKLHFLIAGIDD